MALSEDELEQLRGFRKNLDSDDIKNKEIIKKKLLNNNLIIHVLNNKELEKIDAPADDYYGKNILPYYLIKPTQIDVQNFICYETSFTEIEDYNKCVKYQQIIFYVLCEQKNIIDKDTYLARHDLLAALLVNEFNWTNYFGRKIQCISNKPSVVDTDYACRTLIFQQMPDSNLVKTRNKTPMMVNKEIHV